MAKPETYKGDDAVKLKCLHDYTVKAGSGANAGDDVEYKAGTTYTMNPRSAAHMLRKTRRVFDDPKPGQTRGAYKGDAPIFVDEKAAKEMEAAEKAAAKAAKAEDGK